MFIFQVRIFYFVAYYYKCMLAELVIHMWFKSCRLIITVFGSAITKMTSAVKAQNLP